MVNEINIVIYVNYVVNRGIQIIVQREKTLFSISFFCALVTYCYHLLILFSSNFLICLPFEGISNAYLFNQCVSRRTQMQFVQI